METSYINNRLFLTCMFLILGIAFSFGQVSQKTYQTIIAGNAESVKVDIPGAEVHLKETKGTLFGEQ